MTEAEWLACGDPGQLLAHLEGKASERKLRLFAVACCQYCRQLRLNNDQRDALDVGARFADSEATEEELAEAHRKADGFVTELYTRMSSEDGIRRIAEAYTVATAIRPATTDSDMHTRAAIVTFWIERAVGPDHNPQLADLLRDIFGNPFRPAAFDPAWRTGTVLALATQMYESRDFGAMPILADALQDAGCTSEDVLNHCRDAHATHVRGCWVVDLVLGKG